MSIESTPIESMYGLPTFTRIFTSIYHHKSTKCRQKYNTWILWDIIIIIFWICPFVLFVTVSGIPFYEAEAELAENRMRLEDLYGPEVLWPAFLRVVKV